HYQMTERGVLQVELPYALLGSLIQACSAPALDELVTLCHVDKQYLLGPREEVAEPASGSQPQPTEGGNQAVDMAPVEAATDTQNTDPVTP
ncbi:hypothetical protein, partial [Aeromonas allosaccharophila]